MRFYTPAALMAYANTTDPDQPTEHHMRMLQACMATWPEEELHATISTSRWLLHRPDDREYPEAVQRNSELEHRARICAATRELAHRARHNVSYPHVETGWSRDDLDEIKRRVTIEGEIGLARALHRRGRVLVALCPFHDDHDPSLVVWPDSQRWRCFACDIGGDVIAWAQAWQRCSFSDAVGYLSARAGMALPERRQHRPSLRVRQVARG